MESEHELLNCVLQGDRQAMRRFYDRYAGYAMAVGMRYVPNRDMVADVLQDSFVKIFGAIGRFQYRGEGSLKSWVARIVSNEAVGILRRSAKNSFVDELPDVVDDGAEPDVHGVPTEVLLEMIGKLPVGYRTVLNLFVFEQKSHKEIARLLGIKENSSASQFARAKRMLAEMLKDYKKAEE